jgi:hypothetical protein
MVKFILPIAVAAAGASAGAYANNWWVLHPTCSFGDRPIIYNTRGPFASPVIAITSGWVAFCKDDTGVTESGIEGPGRVESIDTYCGEGATRYLLTNFNEDREFP